MAYNTETLFKTAIEAIEKNKLFFVEDLVAYLPCNRSSFYEHFPADSDKMDVIKEALQKNKIAIKVALRAKWYNSDNATTQLALYKLIGTEEEYHRIANSRHEIKTGQLERPIFPGIDLNAEDGDERNAFGEE